MSEILMEKFKGMLHWVFAAFVSYSVGATLFIRTMTLDIKMLKDSYAAATLETNLIRDRQNKVEVDVVKAVEGFRSDIVGLQTEVRYMRQELRKNK